MQKFTGMLAGCWLLFALPAGSALAQAYQVSSARSATIESIRETVQQGKSSSGLGMIGGALIGGGLGSLVGGGNGRTAATVVGALGGAYVGNNVEKSRSTETVWEIGVRYDNGSWGTIKQSATPPFRVGDRVLVTDSGLEYLR